MENISSLLYVNIVPDQGRYCKKNLFGNILAWRIAVQQECFTIRKTCTRKANREEAMPVGCKKDEKDECLEEYFGTLRTLWLVVNKSTYLENIVLHLFIV